MAPLKLTLGCRQYDGIMPMVHHEVAIPEVEIDFRLNNNVLTLFGDAYAGEFDIAEMSLAELVYYVSREAADFTGIPVFPSRIFRHSCLLCLADSDLDPTHLEGRKVGFQRWVQTAGVWQRGMLADDYHLSPNAVEWYVMSMQHWDGADGDPLQPRNGSVVNIYSTSSASPGLDLCCGALLNGEVDVIGMTEPTALMLSDQRVRRLFQNSQAEEEAYYRRTGIFPIMHVLTMRKRQVEIAPELPAKLFRLFCQSKQVSQSRVTPIPSWSLAWKDEYLDAEKALFEGDPWAFGLEANRHALQIFLDYCFADGIAARPMTPDELFAPDTHELIDSIE